MKIYGQNKNLQKSTQNISSQATMEKIYVRLMKIFVPSTKSARIKNL